MASSGLWLLAAAGLCNVAGSQVAPVTATGAIPVGIELNDPAAWAKLKHDNPEHYARARRIVAAANHLCRPAAASVQETRPAGFERCEPLLLLASNPPRRRLTFVLDQVRYAAVVAITDDPANLMAADGH